MVRVIQLVLEVCSLIVEEIALHVTASVLLARVILLTALSVSQQAMTLLFC